MPALLSRWLPHTQPCLPRPPRPPPPRTRRTSGTLPRPQAAPAGAAAAGGGVGAAPTGLAEEIKRLERGVKYGKASDADVKKLEGLRKKLAAQEEKQRLALDKARVLPRG